MTRGGAMAAVLIAGVGCGHTALELLPHEVVKCARGYVGVVCDKESRPGAPVEFSRDTLCCSSGSSRPACERRRCGQNRDQNALTRRAGSVPGWDTRQMHRAGTPGAASSTHVTSRRPSEKSPLSVDSQSSSSDGSDGYDGFSGAEARFREDMGTF
jgi:hypothetical protein